MSKANGETVHRRRNASPTVTKPKSQPRNTGQPARRVTMRDIAAAVGVHQTTVSFALRNHPCIPEATRARIRAAAKRLGYRPDPLLEAFNFHRLARHPVRAAPTIAFVVDLPRSVFEQAPYSRQVAEGAREAATRRGYLLEMFFTNARQFTPERLNRMLVFRNITDLLVAFSPATTHLALEWNRFCALKIESLHLTPHLDAISSDQRQVTRLGLRRLRELGYRRIGLASARADEARLDDPFRGGLLVEQLEFPPGDRVPPLAFETAAELAALLPAWVKAQRLEAVISNWNNCHEILTTAGLRVPQDVAVASLDAPLDRLQLAGVVQNHRLVGRRAVEHLAILMQTHQRGVPETPSITYVPSYWRDGPSAPRKTDG